MADPADEENVDRDDADPGAADDTKTRGDQPDARQPEKGEAPADGSDDSDATSDPLVLAHMEPEKPAEQPATTPKPKPQPAAQDRAQQPPPKPGDQPAKEQAKAEEPEAEEREALADLPPEDWSKLTHKSKSTFLAQRKVIRSNAERLKAEAKARQEAETRYQTVERFVRDQGLGDEEYVEAVAIGGLVKREDPRAIPVLEERLAKLRAKHGQPAQPVAQAKPAAPQLDADLDAVLRESEELGIDTSKVRARFKATTAPEAPPAAAPAPAAPPAQQAAQARQANQAQPGDDENTAILRSLVALGVPEQGVVEHISGLMAANPLLRNARPGERLEAVLQAHQAAASRPAQLVQTTGQPLSGRGRPPVRPRGTAEPTSDPLKLARMQPPRGR